MRLCQPYLYVLNRSLRAAAVTSAVLAAMTLAAGIALQHLIDLRLGGATAAELVPWGAMLAISAATGGVLALARTTVLNRRQAWLEHELGPIVIEHELHVATDPQQRARSIAAVATLGVLLSGQAARALGDLPWALAGLAGLWMVEPDLAAIASTSALLLVLMAGFGARLTPQAYAFDGAFEAIAAGQDIVLRAGIDRHASLQHACETAQRWEAAQRGRITGLYRNAQAQSRRIMMTAGIVSATALAIATMIVTAPAIGGFTPGQLAATVSGIAIILAVLSRLAIAAPDIAAARAARRHLLLLRAARGTDTSVLSRRPSRPDLRAPIVASLLATAAAVAGLGLVAVQWHLLPPAVEAAMHAAIAAGPLHQPSPIAGASMTQHTRADVSAAQKDSP